MIRDARSVYFNHGLVTLIHAGIWLVWSKTFRQLMPITEPDVRVIDDVKFRNHTKPKARLGDRLIDFREDSYLENAEVNAHKRYTRQGDDVCIIGGGRGTTAIHAARQVGDEGSVTVLEGGEILSLIQEVTELNHLDDVITIKPRIVGKANELYHGMAEDAKVMHPHELPDVDVLEMDCEGSEIEILDALEIRPRVLIVELHPNKFDGPNKAPLQMIQEMGYEIEYCATRLATEIPTDVMEERLVDGWGDVIAATHPSHEQSQHVGEL